MADFAGGISGIPGQPLLPILQYLNPAFPPFPVGSLSPVFISLNGNSKIFTQEIRFTSDWEGDFQLTAGVFYSDTERFSEIPTTALPPIPGEFLDLFNQYTKEDIQEIAVFTEMVYSMTDQVRLIVGGRYFENDVSLENFQGGTFGSGLTVSDEQSESGFNPRLGMQYDFSTEQMLYITASEGYRIGGPNTIPLSVCGDDITNAGLSTSDIKSFKSDSIINYEMGLKSDLMNGRLRVNTSIYKIDWTDIQQAVSFQCGFGATVNAGKAEILGGEFELEYVLAEDINLTVGVGYNDTEITDNGGIDSIIEGEAIQDVPQWTVSSTLDARFTLLDIPFFSYLSVTYVDESEGRRQTGVDRTRDSYSLVNFRIGTDIEDSTVSFYIKNLTDEEADYGNKPPLALDTPGLKRTSVNSPRTIGVEYRYSF